MTSMFDSGLILLREIRCWSILGVKGLIYRHYKAFVLLHFKKKKGKRPTGLSIYVQKCMQDLMKFHETD